MMASSQRHPHPTSGNLEYVILQGKELKFAEGSKITVLLTLTEDLNFLDISDPK